MPTIRFLKNIAPLQVESGTVLMDALLHAGLPVASSCRGDGICGKCRVQVLKGQNQLSPAGALEQIAKERLRIPADTRLSCQSRVLGDVVIDTSYW